MTQPIDQSKASALTKSWHGERQFVIRAAGAYGF